MAKAKTWAMVANGFEVRVLRDIGVDAAKDVFEVFHHDQPRRPRDATADRPGRSYSSAGGGRRSAMDQATDPLEEATRGMVREAVDCLDQHVQKHDFDHLVILASDHVLGLIRHALTPKLKAAVSLELARNLMSLPERKLHEAISDLVKDPPAR